MHEFYYYLYINIYIIIPIVLSFLHIKVNFSHFNVVDVLRCEGNLLDPLEDKTNVLALIEITLFKSHVIYIRVSLSKFNEG